MYPTGTEGAASTIGASLSISISGPAAVVSAQGSVVRSACNALTFGMPHRCCQSSSGSSFTRFFVNAFQPISENGRAKEDPLGLKSSMGIVADVS
jgi:hypothetical protein